MLTPEDYVVTAIATDDGGARAMSLPIAVTVVGTADRPILAIRWMQSHAMLSWTPANAILQEADSPVGQWHDLPNAPNPSMILPTEKAKFHRAYLP